MGTVDEFNRLPKKQQQFFCRASNQLVPMARNCAIPVAPAPPPAARGKTNHASDFALHLDSDFFFVTASHFLTQYEIRLQNREYAARAAE